MADSTGMTIEFLRARLLSERSISKTAKQKADGLAKRVVELEEQLKHSTLQRKNAEKATSEVLAILESHGISDLSEVYDSSSDQEEDEKESKEVNNVKREEGKFHESSKSEPGSFPSLGRSLSWKSCSGSLENTKARRRSSLISSAESSPRRRVGKSCRQIKQRKSRSDENGVKDEIHVETQENTVITKKPSTITGLDGSGKSPEMEKALEYQARLIDQFEEAQENAQREWEEKFKENNCYSPDSIEHGNQSDVTEERDDIRADMSSEAAHPTSPLPAEQGNSATEQSTTNGNPNPNPNPNKIPPTKHQSREEVEPNSRSNETQKEEWFENNSSYSASHASSSKGESSGNAIQPQHETGTDLGRVLDALKWAKQSIKQELDRPKGRPPAEVPMSPGGMFRGPPTTSNTSYMDTHRPSPMDPYMDKGMDLLSSSRLMYPSYINLMPKSSTRMYPNLGFGMASEERYTDYNDRLRLDMYKR